MIRREKLLNDGTRGHKQIEFRVCGMPDGVKDSHIVQHARPGRAFKDEVVDEALERMSQELEKKFPAWEFRLVELGPARFNFVWAGRRT